MARTILFATKKSLHEGETVFLVERRAIIIVDVMVADEIMSCFFLLPLCRGGGTYWYLRIYLPRVGIDHWRAEVPGYGQRGLALAHTRWAEKNKQCIQDYLMMPRLDVEMKSMMY